MDSIALNRIVVGAALALAGGGTLAARAPPEIMREPVFGLRYETANVKFDLFFFTDRGTCTVLDMPRQVFDDRIFDDEMSPPILKQLAADVVRRLIRSFGGADRLRIELRNQHITQEDLPPELLEAIGPYLPR